MPRPAVLTWAFVDFATVGPLGSTGWAAPSTETHLVDMASDLDLDELDQLVGFDDLTGGDALDLGIDEPPEASEARNQWRVPLDEYLRNQGAVDALRLRSSDEAPWPQDDNPMFRFLIERAAELVDGEDTATAMQWLAARAWFEATLAERSRIARLLVDDD